MNTDSGSLNEATVREKLREVVDPEVGLNIIDLGLIYRITIDRACVSVQMTLTTPGCPMQECLTWGVQSALLSLPGVEDAQVEVVWDPPWDHSRISPAGRALLGETPS